MLDFDDDLNEIFSEDEHAVCVLYKGRDFSGILNNEFISQGSGDIGIESTNPVLYVPTIEVEEAAHGDEIHCDNKKYEVVGNQPDGTGVSVLVLNEA